MRSFATVWTTWENQPASDTSSVFAWKISPNILIACPDYTCSESLKCEQCVLRNWGRVNYFSISDSNQTIWSLWIFFVISSPTLASITRIWTCIYYGHTFPRHCRSNIWPHVSTALSNIFFIVVRISFTQSFNLLTNCPLPCVGITTFQTISILDNLMIIVFRSLCYDFYPFMHKGYQSRYVVFREDIFQIRSYIEMKSKLKFALCRWDAI